VNRNPRVLLLYPPEQNWPDTLCKPNGSLAYPMLGGALRDMGVDVEVYDACVGNDNDNYKDFFFNPTPLDSGLLRTGVTDERILEVVKDFDFVGITSIFSLQETMVLHCCKLIKKHFPEKILFSGGVNARARYDVFLDAGFDIVCTSESEITVQEIMKVYISGSEDWSPVPKILYRKDGKTMNTSALGEVIWDLDKLPMPAWDLLPNERYWEIGRPHGGHFKDDEELKYVSMMTSLGCPFACSYCHIAHEKKGSLADEIGKFRVKSDERVLEELLYLRDTIGAKQVFIEDDSIFGKKKRAIRMLKKIIGLGMDILDVNGVNVIHLTKKTPASKMWLPDVEVIELLAEAGFRDIVLPFESANPRIIQKWCSNKWRVDNFDVEALVKEIKRVGMRAAANYMIGFPDETEEEINQTIEFAKKNMTYGLDASNFFLVMPLPGTPMFDEVIANGQLPKDYNIDRMQWTRANMINTSVSPERLEEIRQKAWEDCNLADFKDNRKSWVVADKNTGEIHKGGCESVNANNLS
tara:strand:- start:3531 stop:5102 length:1572 start_codon:yes stop_codon:yes gene_type:complete